MTFRDRVRLAAKGALRRVDPDLARYADIKPYLQEALPDDLDRLSPDAFVPSAEIVGSGIDFREAEQVALLERWAGKHHALFDLLRHDATINTFAAGSGHLHNGQYATPDAEVYAAMIVDYQPRRIIEIGAGYSTRIARKTIDTQRLDTQIVVIDPQPRADIDDVADRVLRERIEDVDPGQLGLDDRTLFFIDSSHIVRARGDVPVLFCSLVPSLPAGALVHVHDVFLPFDYPDAYRRRLYGEEYVLWALLVRSPSFEVRLATHQMVRTRTALMQRVFGPTVGVDEKYFGASFWFEVVGPRTGTDPIAD